MKLNVENLSIEVKKYNKLVNDYEELYFDYYNELNFVKEDCWQGNDANYFFANIDEEKIRIQLFYKELFSIGDVYQYLVKKYQLLGKKLVVDLSQRDSIINKFNNYIVKLDNLIDYYKNIDVSFDATIREYIIKQQLLLEKNRVEIRSIKDKYKSFFANIEEIELEIKERLSKINIDLIKENTTKLKALGTDTNPYMNTKNMENGIKILQYYKNEEDITFESIQDVFQNIIYNYDTDNKNLLDNLLLDINNRIKIIGNNHLNELTILRDKLSGHRDTSNKVTQILDDAVSNFKLSGDL